MNGHGPIVLTIPGERRYLGVVRLFLGGLAARLDLGIDMLDDLQLALENIINACPTRDQITLEVQLERGLASILVGMFDENPLETSRGRAHGLDLRRLLAALVAQVESEATESGWRLRLDVPVPTETPGQRG